MSSSESLGFTGFHWVSLCVKCYRMVDIVPRWQLSLSRPTQSDHLLIADWMIPPLGWEYSRGKTQYIPVKKVLVRSWLWKSNKKLQEMFASYFTGYLLKFWTLSHLLEGVWILIMSFKISLDIYSNFKWFDKKCCENLQGAVWKFRCVLLKVSSSLWACIMLSTCIRQGFFEITGIRRIWVWI